MISFTERFKLRKCRKFLMLFPMLVNLLHARLSTCRFGTVLKFGNSDKFNPTRDRSVSADVSNGISSSIVGALSSVIGAQLKADRSLSSSLSVLTGVSAYVCFSASVSGIDLIKCD